MDDRWTRIRALEGKAIVTIAGRETFDLGPVDDKRLWVTPRRTGTPRGPIQRTQFERVEQLGLATRTVAPSDIRRVDPASRNTTYIAAIIREALRG
jgi:hypothetical protein